MKAPGGAGDDIGVGIAVHYLCIQFVKQTKGMVCRFWNTLIGEKSRVPVKQKRRRSELIIDIRKAGETEAVEGSYRLDISVRNVSGHECGIAD